MSLPNQPDRHAEVDRMLERAAQLGQSGRLSEAAGMCRQILQNHPNTARAWHFLGLAALQQGQFQEALSNLEQAITLSPNTAEFYNHVGVVHFSLGDFNAGINSYQQALALQPQSIDAQYNLALGLQKLNRIDEAIAIYEQLIAQQPSHAQAHCHLGNALQQQYRFQVAIAHYQQAIALQPNFAEAWFNLGVAWQSQSDNLQAKAAYERALAINPQYAEAHNGLGTILETQGHGKAAIDSYQRALAINRNYIDAWFNLANVQHRLSQDHAAIESYREVLVLNPNHAKALDGLIGALLQTGQWTELESLTAQLWQVAQNRISQNLPSEVSPLSTLYLPFTAAQQQAIASDHAQTIRRQVTELHSQLNFDRTRQQNRENLKIRLGYVSGDYRNHAVAHLMLRLFELHDRNRFEVFAYSLSPDDGSEYRQKLMADCDRFRDVYNLSPREIARLINADQIDIAIDLAGYTEHAMPEVFALRPAPIQINYLGYPGTLGADYIDYIITDRVIVPPELAVFMTEQCLYLPDSYQINDRWEPPTESSPKSQWGLPEDAFIYCCFNKAQKIEPTIFAAWMRILRQVPKSVLWLLQDSPEFETRLKAAATAQGVERDRLIFAPRLPKHLHMQRHQCADLFLDTLYYNAHTTASDALRAGVPLVTVLGETFAGRVAASLLTAIGLPEAIAPNLAAYERLAVELGQDPTKYARLKQKLLENLPTTSLFDSQRTVKNLESTYNQVWQAHQSGRSLQQSHISSAEKPSSEIPFPDSNNTPRQERQFPSTQIASDRDLPLDSSAHKIINCSVDLGFQEWIAQAGGSLAITTYQAGKLALVGWNGQQVSFLMREFTKPMGMAVSGQRLALATKHEVILFANASVLAHHYIENQPGRYDALYLPRAAYFTGDLNVHDLAFGADGLWLVNTRFSCLSRLSAEFSFVPQWQPSFISELAPEDRCHLNGLAMVQGKLKFVTALGESDQVGGWRANKATGGIVIDIDSNEIILRGLSMPHSPYWHKDALWLLNSGTGELWRVDPRRGSYEVICALPGFLRGLCFVGNYALIGLCQMRETNIFGGLQIQERYDRLLCGVAVVDILTGNTAGFLEFTSGCEELYGIQFLSNTLRPTILNAQDDAVRDAFTAPEFSYWLRPSFLMPPDSVSH